MFIFAQCFSLVFMLTLYSPCRLGTALKHRETEKDQLRENTKTS